jgi:hypothetical protein
MNKKNLYHEIKITRQHLFSCSLKDKPVDKDTMVLILSPNDMMEKGLLLLMHSHVMQSKVNQKERLLQFHAGYGGLLIWLHFGRIFNCHQWL